MDDELGFWGTVFDLEGIVDRGDIDSIIESLRPDVIYTIKQAIADWELAVEKRDYTQPDA